MIDSHVHLFAETHLDQLAWMTTTNPLRSAHRVDEYIDSASPIAVTGIIFIEVDRKHTSTDWSQPIAEYEYICHIIAGTLLPAEGTISNKTTSGIPVVGMVPWAPIPFDFSGFEGYVRKLKQSNSECFKYVKGFRYLVQNDPPGTMLTDNFVSALNWLGLHDFVFDLGIDLRSGGLWQYEEALEMMRRAPNTRYIINHLGKPDLRIPRSEVSSRKEFLGWKYAMSEFSKFDSYVKLSGAFSELPPLDKYCEEDLDNAVEVVYPWASAVYENFGAKRIMWGSDWPVCKLGGKEDALRNWKYICDRLVDRIGFSDEEKEWVWEKTCIKAYNL
ncbi:hypothetical protein V1520DRAFT_350676 [Lipomyces starkeyi]|uniref:Amidohydrolase-related domain-containing protein n=1 Tax=Lipomyces starkeyi NRRL Y-11557 TaxID=675824 RepID=A0A1E3QE87_LIPST|nr:hypothetical protein LIPSTDRAFT_204820 [Lipomyces starkeyi NRRL Y-11557]